jgi:heme A synthase
MSVNETVVAGRGATPSIRARIFSVLSALLALLIIIQVFVAASGLFVMAHQLDNGQNYTVSSWNSSAYWSTHFLNALAITLVTLLLLGASFLAQLPGRTKRFAGLLLGLLVLQAVLGFIPWPAPISALHVFNAFVMLGVAGYVARENWAFGRPAS